MADQIVETSSQGWGSRLIESIKAVLVGLLFFVVSFPLLWWNEGRAVQTYESLKEGAGAVVSIVADRVEPANEGKLVHITGKAVTTENLADPVFGISATALRLERQVEMYQWIQHEKTEKKKKTGGSEETVTTYTYEKEWHDGLVDSTVFKSPSDHQNPSTMPYTSEYWRPTRATVGAFVLSPKLLDDIRENEHIAVTAEMLKPKAEGPAAAAEATPQKAVKGKKPAPPAKAKHLAVKGKKAKAAAVVASHTGTAPAAANLPGNLKVANGAIVIGADPATPQIGDLRISFSKVPFTEVSVVAQQAKDTFEPYQTKAGNALEMLRPRTMTAAAMFAAAQTENTILTWILRLVGFVLMAAGLFMVFRPLAVVADVLPFLGDVLRLGIGVLAVSIAAPLTLVTIAIAWIVYRPVLGIILLVSGVAALVLVKMLAAKKKAAATAPQGAATPAPPAAPAAAG